MLVDQKPVVMAAVSNTNKQARVSRVRDLLAELIRSLTVETETGTPTNIQDVLSAIGVQGKILDVSMMKTKQNFDEDTKIAIVIQQSWQSASKCPICGGYMLPSQSVSFDHKTRVRDGGLGTASNGQMVHPFCNSGVKS
jgi:flagellin-specific chaperone FliS